MASAAARMSLSVTLVGEVVPAIPAHGRGGGDLLRGERQGSKDESDNEKVTTHSVMILQLISRGLHETD